MMKANAPVSVEAYLDGVEATDREALEALRRIIQDEVPDAIETISYGMPMFKWNGMLAGYAAFANHCSFFPGGIVEEFKDDLAGYKTSKGTVQFSADRPIPEELVRRIVRAAVARNAAKERR